MSSSESPSPSATRWPDYRAVWRWHFYAGIFCIPFVVVLAISGAIYLFKADIEGWAERSLAILLLERLVLRRVAPVKTWLGSA